VRFLNAWSTRIDSTDAEPLEFSMLFRMITPQRDQVPVDNFRWRPDGLRSRPFAARL